VAAISCSSSCIQLWSLVCWSLHTYIRLVLYTVDRHFWLILVISFVLGSSTLTITETMLISFSTKRVSQQEFIKTHLAAWLSTQKTGLMAHSQSISWIWESILSGQCTERTGVLFLKFITVLIFVLYTVFHKSGHPFLFRCIFTKPWPIFQIPSLLEMSINFQQSRVNISNHTSTVWMHNRVKIRN